MRVELATHDVIRAFYEKRRGVVSYTTMRAHVLFDETVDPDVPVMIGGIGRYNGLFIMFIDAYPGYVKSHAKVVLRCAKRLLKLADEKGWKVYAQADPEIEGSDRLVEHLGFKLLQDRVYVR